MKRTGYIWRKNFERTSNFLPIYWDIDSLRLSCGEVPIDEITKVEVREVRDVSELPEDSFEKIMNDWDAHMEKVGGVTKEIFKQMQAQLAAQKTVIDSAEKVLQDIRPQIRGALRIQDIENWLRDYRALKEKYG